MMVTENRRKNCCFLLFNPIIAQICTVCNSICKKKSENYKKNQVQRLDSLHPIRFFCQQMLLTSGTGWEWCLFRVWFHRQQAHIAKSIRTSRPYNTPLSKKKTTGFLFSYKCIVSFQLFKNDKTADFFAQKQTQTESLSELFFRILFLHLLIGVCLIIKYSIVRLLYCFCWLLHIVYDVWTGTPYQCRCAGCSRLFAGITTPVLIKIHCTMSQMFISVRMMES